MLVGAAAGEAAVINWDAIGALGEVIGAVAVIASLLYVGFQLRQGQLVERAAAQRELLLQCKSWFGSASESQEKFDAIRAALADFDAASEFEKEVFSAWGFGIVFICEMAYYMHRDGFLNDASFYGVEQGTLGILRTSGGQRWWALSREIVGTDISAHLDRRLAELGDAIPPWDELVPHLKRQLE